MVSPSLLSIKTHGSPQNLFYEKYIRLVKEDNYEEIFTLLAEKMSEQDSKDKGKIDFDINEERKEQEFIFYVVLQFSKQFLLNDITVPKDQSTTLLHISCENESLDTVK